MFLFVNYYEYERSTFRVDKILITGENVFFFLLKTTQMGHGCFIQTSTFNNYFCVDPVRCFK